MVEGSPRKDQEAQVPWEQLLQKADDHFYTWLAQKLTMSAWLEVCSKTGDDVRIAIWRSQDSSFSRKVLLSLFFTATTREPSAGSPLMLLKPLSQRLHRSSSYYWNQLGHIIVFRKMPRRRRRNWKTKCNQLHTSTCKNFELQLHAFWTLKNATAAQFLELKAVVGSKFPALRWILKSVKVSARCHFAWCYSTTNPWTFNWN